MAHLKHPVIYKWKASKVWQTSTSTEIC